jgi:hypothetical protein
MKKVFATAIFLFATSTLVAAPTVKLKVDVSPREIHIGDVIQYNLTVIHSTDLAPAPFNVPQPLGAFDILAIAPAASQKSTDGQSQLTQSLALTTFSTGPAVIPSLSVSFKLPDGSTAEAKTEAVPIKVKSILEEMGDKGGLMPLKGLFNFRSYFWLWMLLGLLAAGVIAYFVARAIHRRKHGADGPAEPPRPPEETALEAIQKLESSGLLEQGHTKEFYFELGIIFRRYLEQRYALSALDRTTSELYADFREMKMSGDFLSQVRPFFNNADLVKFAKFAPTPEEISEDVLRAKKMIEMTTPVQVDVKPEEKIPV